MASAVLTSRNDQRSSDYMNNFTNNRNLNFIQNISNSNPNCNPSSSLFFVENTSRGVLWKPNQHLPSSAPSQPAFIRSPINAVPASSSGYGYRCITFRISSYTKTELQKLKKRLVSDLERVRNLQQWICFTTTQRLNYHPPALKLPVVAESKRAVGQKRANPLPTARDTKKQCVGRMTVTQRRKMMKKCEQILGKLMKHKHGWVFNTPVDAAALKLYDYHNVITNPMDLGTIRSKLARNQYESPLAFASDVRLTFQNAMVYNGRGSAVYIMAEQLLLMFEELYNSLNLKRVVNRVKKQNRSVSVPVVIEKPVVRVLKKREMTDEEKSELAEGFCNLNIGPEGISQIMGILKRGVLGLEHQGDEIELDLAVLDSDMLWALHSVIARARKEQSTITNLISSVQADCYAGNECLAEEDVDIGEEMHPTVYPSVEIEKDAVSVGSSESSSESDSSSSDSGSGNSCNEQEEVNSTPKVVQ